MFEDIGKYIGDTAILSSTYAVEFGKYAIPWAYKKLISPGEKVGDAFVLGYYLPWLIFAKGLNDSVFDEDLATLFDKFTAESYVFDAAIELQLDVNRDYIYNIKSNALVEKNSMSQKLLSAEKSEKESMAFNFGISLSESIITFNDSETRYKCIAEAQKLARELELGEDAQRVFGALRGYDKARFDAAIERIAIAFINNHKK